ncbi:LptF/LptG family permease [Lacihabitans lacunae]|uniref:LptF/LptG family permease n=1 Tax=Lacihabitans lacunae TaxID=1028214 RepID=A0ABV7Z2C0_9BACT
MFFTKIDKQILFYYIKPFVATTVVMIFLFTIRFLVMHLSDVMGKNIGIATYFDIFTNFPLVSIPFVLPLATLIASILCFGKLTEHNELTAISASGVKRSRAVYYVFFFTLIITTIIIKFNTDLAPIANYKSFHTVLDIRSKIGINIKPKVFFNKIEGISIKSDKVWSQKGTSYLQNILLYQKEQNKNQNTITIARSGKITTSNNEEYLMIDLNNGISYVDSDDKSLKFTKTNFSLSKIILPLKNDIKFKNEEKIIISHAYTKNIAELYTGIHNANKEVKFYSYLLKNLPLDRYQNIERKYYLHSKANNSDSLNITCLDELVKALNNKDRKSVLKSLIERDKREHLNTIISFQLEIYQRYMFAISNLIFCLFGCSIGVFIKKGNIGYPILIGIAIYLLFYLFCEFFEKLSKNYIISPELGVFLPFFGMLCLWGIFELSIKIKSKN